MLRRVGVCVVLAGLVTGCIGRRPSASDRETPPAPSRFVTDRAGLLSEPARAMIDRDLERFEVATGHQVIVWIGETTGGVPIEGWAARVFSAWGVGRKGLDDGAALFIFAEDRRARIEVGYGLEPVLTDAIAGRVLDEELIPRLRAGDPDGGVTAAVDRMLEIIRGDKTITSTAISSAPPSSAPPVEPAHPDPGERPLDIGRMIIFGIIGLGFLILFARNPALAIMVFSHVFRGGGGRGGGGGFSGGGGRSGGGGASRSW